MPDTPTTGPHDSPQTGSPDRRQQTGGEVARAAGPEGPEGGAHAPRRAISVGTLISVLVMVVLALAAWYWSNVLLQVFGAILIAVALRAGARPLHRHLGIDPKIGVVLVILAVLGVIAVVARLAGSAIAEQFRTLVGSLPDSWDAVSDYLSQTAVGAAMQERMEEGVDLGQNASEVAQRLPDILAAVTGALNATVGGVMSLFLILFMALYLAIESSRYRDGVVALFPLHRRDRVRQILSEMGEKLGLWLGGQALDMLAVAVLVGLGLWLLDVPLVFILALIAGLTNIIPIIGPFLSGGIAVLFSLTQGFDVAVQVALLFLVIQLIDGEIILPLIQRFAVSLPPALTVVGILAFGGLFGFAGVLLATPILVVLIVLIQRAYVEDVLGDRLD